MNRWVALDPAYPPLAGDPLMAAQLLSPPPYCQAAAASASREPSERGLDVGMPVGERRNATLSASPCGSYPGPHVRESPAGQKEKMLAGQLYMATDPELSAAHLRAQAILAKFNATSADAEAERHTLLTELFERLGEGTVLKPTLRCDYGFNVAIGNRTFINYDCLLLDCNRITMGDDVQIAPGVHIYTATHPIEAKARRSVLSTPCPS
jgi:maltose O-acetyltransferase